MSGIRDPPSINAQYIPRLAEVENAYITLGKFMRSLIISKKAQIASQNVDSKSDLFSRLVQANEAEESKVALDDDEVVSSALLLGIEQHVHADADCFKIGNVFGFLLAGHGE